MFKFILFTDEFECNLFLSDTDLDGLNALNTRFGVNLLFVSIPPILFNGPISLLLLCCLVYVNIYKLYNQSYIA